MRNEAPQRRSDGVSRRGLLTGAAGLTFAITLPTFLIARPHSLAAQEAARQVGAWVTIGTDGIVTIAAPAAEMGQGVMTALPMVFADEMDADWAMVRAVFSPPNAEVFGNPAWGGILLSVGSKTCEGYWQKVRQQAAAVRKFLVQTAATSWGVASEEARTEPSVVVHDGSGRRMSYADVAALVPAQAQLPQVQDRDFKKPSDYRIIGHSQPRLDVPAKVDGSASYGMDVRLPDMVYATVLRAPVEGAHPAAVDDAAAKAIPGVTHIVPLDHAVGIVAQTVEAAFAARSALRVAWSKGDLAGHDSDAVLQRFAARARNLDERGAVFVTEGDLQKAIGSSQGLISAEYASDYVYHAQMEPMNVTARVDPTGDGAELWLGTQAQSATLAAAAAVLKTTPDRIRLNQQYLGGGFGRRGMTDLIPEVLALAKATGSTVKLMWTRDQDVQSARMRPLTAHFLQAALDGSGRIVGWRHRLVAESVLYYRGAKVLEQAKGLDNIVLEGAKHPYEIPNQSIEYLVEKSATPLSAWRGIGAGYNKFAIECFIDEIAARRGVDPVALRRDMLRNNARALAVIDKTAQMAGWGRKPDTGRAFGFSFGQIVDSWTAGVAEISVDRDSGEIRVHQFWTAIDPGIVINPDTIRAQTEGNVVFGLSQTLRERITIKDGQVQQSNYNDYPVLRLAEIPEIHVEIIPTDNPPTGIGEAALPLVACCVANAFYALTGKRLRALPLSPPRVKAALAES